MAGIEFKGLFQSFTKLKVAVIGDVMLDTYWWGHVERISPEAPVPIITIYKKEQRIGGAGNVALNVHSLGSSITILGVVGQDEESKLLKTMMEERGIITKYLIESKHRITTNKIRIISRNQHMMRLDAEIVNDIGKEDEDQLISSLEACITSGKPDVLIMEDYNKGVLTGSVISRVIQLCKKNNILTCVDPKRNNFFSFRNVDIFKPNLKEVMEGLNIISGEVNLDILIGIHQQMEEKLEHQISFITLSEKGVFYKQGNRSGIIPTHIREVADVSGAGDTVIAVAAVVYAATMNVELMAEISNIAGGIVCEEVGTVPIDSIRLQEECEHLLNRTGSPVSG